MRLFLAISLALFCCGAAGCDGDTAGYADDESKVGPDGGPLDGAGTPDFRWPDLGAVADAGVDAVARDVAYPDGAIPPDAARPADGRPDRSRPDQALPDLAPDLAADLAPPPDANPCGNRSLDPGETCDDGVTTRCTTDHDGGDGRCVPPGTCSSGYVLDGAGNCMVNPTGLSTPCQTGPGWTLFRFHYGGNSRSPSIDVWDASCSYSYAPNSACNVYAVYPGFGDVSYSSQGYPILTSSEYLRVRFSVSGLSFTRAAVYLRARSYATSSSTYYQVWSPLYGGLESGPVDNDWVYDWYGLDWTGLLHPGDQPSLTAIQIYAGRGSGKLAVRAVELCVE